MQRVLLNKSQPRQLINSVKQKLKITQKENIESLLDLQDYKQGIECLQEQKYKQSIDYLHRAEQILQLYSQGEQQYNYIHILNKLALGCIHVDQRDKAIHYLQKVVNVQTQTHTLAQQSVNNLMLLYIQYDLDNTFELGRWLEKEGRLEGVTRAIYASALLCQPEQHQAQHYFQLELQQQPDQWLKAMIFNNTAVGLEPQWLLQSNNNDNNINNININNININNTKQQLLVESVELMQEGHEGKQLENLGEMYLDGWLQLKNNNIKNKIENNKEEQILKEESGKWLKECLDYFQQHKGNIGPTLLNLATFHQFQQQTIKAEGLFRHAFTLYNHNYSHRLYRGLQDYSHLLTALKRHTEAEDYAKQAQQVKQQLEKKGQNRLVEKLILPALLL